MRYFEYYRKATRSTDERVGSTAPTEGRMIFPTMLVVTEQHPKKLTSSGKMSLKFNQRKLVEDSTEEMRRKEKKLQRYGSGNGAPLILRPSITF